MVNTAPPNPIVLAFIATLTISIVPFVLLFLIFKCRRSASSANPLNPHILRIFVCFAIGGLLGDAFLHLIPHSIQPHPHSHGDGSNEQMSAIVQTIGAWLNLYPTDAHSVAKPVSSTSSFAARSHRHEVDAHDHEHDDEWLSDHYQQHEHDHVHDDDPGHDHGHTPTPSPSKSPSKPHDHLHEDHAHSHDHSHNENEHRVGLLVLLGVLIFFCIEKFARLRAGMTGDASGEHGHYHGGHSHGHSHSDNRNHHDDHVDNHEEQLVEHVKQLRVSDDTAEPTESASSTLVRRKRGGKNTANPQLSPTAASSIPPSAVKITHIDSMSDSESPVSAESRLVGLLNLIADLSHNFTDGLAITVSFLSSPLIGLSTTIAVLTHEIPHEIGDFAILIQAGYSIKQAMLFQLYTAVGALAGVGVVAMMRSDSGSESGSETPALSWILPVTAGGFIYVALVNVLPTILNSQPLRANESKWWPYVRCLTELASMIGGVALMIAIGQLE